MKYSYLILLLLAVFFYSCNSQNIYFSYMSPSNIIFKVSGNNAEAMIAGKKYNGRIMPNKYDKDVFDFNSNDSLVFMFMKERNDEIIIINQDYNIPDASEKAIELLLINSENNMRLLYENGPDYVLENTSLMNDKAYYLESVGAYDEAIFILEKVISKNPDRIVAYLNIGDSYWNKNQTGKAKDYYIKYIELMKAGNKDLNKIPQRVYERTKQN